MRDIVCLRNIKISWEIIILFVVCTSFSFIHYNSDITSDNMNYAIEEIHQYNNEIFYNNLGVSEEENSPRYFANFIVSIGMRLFGVSWAGIASLIIRINYILYGIAAANIAYRLSHSNALLYGLLLLSCIYRDSMGMLAGFRLAKPIDIFLGTGTAVALIGMSFIIGEKKDWLMAWICMAAATLLHVHEGMWGGCVL